MGFFGVALATTFIGEVTLAFATGLATLSGKSFDPFFQGAVVSSSAGGAGVVKSLEGDHVMGSGGMEGKFGCAGAGGVGIGVVVLLVPVPQEIRRAIPVTSTMGSVAPRQAREQEEATLRLIGLTSVNFHTDTSTSRAGGKMKRKLQ